MELFEIEEKIVKESQTYTPNVYENIVAAAQAEGLLNASAAGNAVGYAAADGALNGYGAVAKATVATGFKKGLLIFAAAIGAAAIAVGSITAAVVLSSDDGGLSDSAAAGSGIQDETDGNGETGGNGEDTKLTTYVGLTYKFIGASLPNSNWPFDEAEGEVSEAHILWSSYTEGFSSSTITFPTADTFTLKFFNETIYTGAAEKSAYYDYADDLSLDVSDIPMFQAEDDYASVMFGTNYNSGNPEVNYEILTIIVIPEGKTPEYMVYLLYNLDK